MKITPEPYGVYRVTGNRRYRGHEPGTTFEAMIDPGPERRAVDRGDIELLGRFTPDLQPGSFVLPDDWPPTSVSPASTEVPEGAFSTEGGG